VSFDHAHARARVTIALPVYNGEAYLEQALTDLLGQDYPDFELYVSDNASTDRTPKIIADAAASDRRVHPLRHQQNIGAYRNFDSVIGLARTPYFLFAAHDDRWDTRYLGRLVEQLDRNPRAVIACTDAAVIDEYSNRTGKIYPSAYTVGKDLPGRVRTLVSQFAWLETYGLMRSQSLNSIGSFKTYIGADVNFILEMTILGEIEAVREPFFFYRMPSEKVTDHAYYARGSPMSPHEPQTYTSLVKHLYRTLIRAQLSEATVLAARHAMIEAIGVPGGEWFAAIGGERRFNSAAVSLDIAQGYIASLLDEAASTTALGENARDRE